MEYNKNQAAKQNYKECKEVGEYDLWPEKKQNKNNGRDSEMMQLGDKNVKATIINILCLRRFRNHEHKRIKGRYFFKDPKGTLEMKIKYLKWKYTRKNAQ